AAQPGDYKVVPENDAARTFEGEGDASFAATEGVEPAGRVDPSRMPEEPAVTPAEREAAATAAAAKRATDKAAAMKAQAVHAAAAGSAQAGPTAASVKTASGDAKGEAAAGSGALVQLGAFRSEAAANKAWANLSKRFAYLAELNRFVSAAE